MKRDSLRESIRLLYASAWQDGFFGATKPEYEQRPDLITDKAMALIDEYADYVVGEMDEHTEQCAYYRKSHQNGKVCICLAKQRNVLRIEQRERKNNDTI